MVVLSDDDYTSSRNENVECREKEAEAVHRSKNSSTYLLSITVDNISDDSVKVVVHYC